MSILRERVMGLIGRVDRLLPGVSERVIGIPLTIAIEGSERDYINLFNDEGKIRDSVINYLKSMTTQAKAATGAVNIARWMRLPIDKFDLELMDREGMRSISVATHRFDGVIAYLSSRRTSEQWTPEDQARHARWLAATAAIYLAREGRKTEFEGIQDELYTTIRRQILNGAQTTANLGQAIIDNRWLTNVVVPSLTDFTTHYDTQDIEVDVWVSKMELLDEYVNAPLKG